MTTASVRPPRSRRRSTGTPIWVPLLFLAPTVLLFLGFLVYPMVMTVRLSFFEWTGFRIDTPSFVGLDNYVQIFTRDPVFWTAFRNTVLWLVLSLLVPTTLGLLLALGLNQRVPGRNVMRSLIYIPGVLASIAVATMWVWMYNPVSGLINSVLRLIGLGAVAQDWLGSPTTALLSIFVASVWQGTGFGMILFLAGLQNVPAELVDAARVDGAGRWQTFRAVTLPALRPTTVVVIVLTLINSLKVFDLIVGMTGGGPVQSTQVLALWSYTSSFTNHQFGLGNAIATVLLAVSLVLVVPYMIWTMKGDRE